MVTNRYGRETTAEEIGRAADLSGRLAIVTGATSGIGRETARALALAGADLVIGVRDASAGETLRGELADVARGTVEVLPLELSDLKSVMAFAERIDRAVDLLIANAGVSKTPDSHLPNGLDVRFATNHLGHFCLALALRARMAAGGARIVVLSSAAHKGMPVRLDDLQWRIREHSMAAYGEAKSANILFAQEATRRWARYGSVASAVLPGTAMTGLQRYHGGALKREIGFYTGDGALDPAVKASGQAAATTLWAATAPELAGRGGLVLEDCAEALPVGPDTHPWSGFDARVADPSVAAELWDISVALVRKHLGERAPADD